ncbi:MAG TPA: hypothetical protein VLH86_06090 [Patescibacteria group bacterium]|nr:hypothetical protein [Patescibacteria group bacterium]
MAAENGDAGSTAELLIQIAGVQQGVEGLPLGQTREALGAIPMAGIVATIEGVPVLQAERDTYRADVGELEHAASNLAGVLAAVLNETNNPHALAAQDNLQAISGHTEMMSRQTVLAMNSLDAAFVAINEALMEAKKARDLIEAARREAELAETSRAAFSENIGGYIADIS